MNGLARRLDCALVREMLSCVVCRVDVCAWGVLFKNFKSLLPPAAVDEGEADLYEVLEEWCRGCPGYDTEGNRKRWRSKHSPNGTFEKDARRR